MMDFLSQAQRWPAPSKGVHDEHHLFPFNPLIHLRR